MTPLLIGLVVGWIIGFAHCLDRSIERHAPVDLAKAWQTRRVGNTYAAPHGNRWK